MKPKLFSVMKHYNAKQFFLDMKAGIIVAIIALAVVGIVFVYNLLFGAKAVDLEPAATEDVISTAKAVLFGGEIL